MTCGGRPLDNQLHIFDVYYDVESQGLINKLYLFGGCLFAAGVLVTTLVSFKIIHVYFLIFNIIGVFGLKVILHARLSKTFLEEGPRRKVFSFEPESFLDHWSGKRFYWRDGFKYSLEDKRLELKFTPLKFHILRHELPDKGASIRDYLYKMSLQNPPLKNELVREIKLSISYRYISDVAGSAAFIFYLFFLFGVFFLIAAHFDVWGRHLDTLRPQVVLFLCVGLGLSSYFLILSFKAVSRPEPLLYRFSDAGILDYKDNKKYKWSNIKQVTFQDTSIFIQFVDTDKPIALNDKILPYLLDDTKRLISKHVSSTLILVEQKYRKVGVKRGD